MKYIRGFNESIEEEKKWMNTIINTCKDIMIELEDSDIKTDVKKSLQSDKSVLIECIIHIGDGEIIHRFRKVFIGSEVKTRLVDYMESEGFELVNYSPYVRDEQFKISFKKYDIDNDYIGHLFKKIYIY